MGRFERLKAWAKRLKAELRALYLAYKDPRVPTYARVFTIIVVAYAFSPIDLILVPLGIALAVRMIPPTVLTECRARARDTRAQAGPKGTAAAVAVVVIWLLLAVLAVYLVGRVVDL